MRHIDEEIASFRKRRVDAEARSLANAALLTVAGVGIEEALKADSVTCSTIRIRVRRLLERERLRGLKHHSSYDLKKHIGLKTAFDMLHRHGKHLATLPASNNRRAKYRY